MRTLLAMLTALSVFVPTANDVSAQDVSLPLGTQGPSATVEDLDGNEMDLLALLDGKPALLEFWATWCEQCEALQPEIDRVQAAYGDEVKVVAVAVAVAQSVRRVQRHIADAGHDYPFVDVVLDPVDPAFRFLGQAGDGLPEALFQALQSLFDAPRVGPDQDLMGAVERVLGRD